jgi:hypothetical protein
MTELIFEGDWGEDAIAAIADTLSKAATPQTKFKDGKRYILNSNNRWERSKVGSNENDYEEPTLADFQFAQREGEYGRAIYFDVGMPGDGMQVVFHLAIAPEQLISGEDYLALEDDYRNNIGKLLSDNDIHAIFDGDRLAIFGESDITPLGFLRGSGEIPTDLSGFRITNLEPDEEFGGYRATCEMQGKPLSKSALRCRQKGLPRVDRKIVSAAVRYCSDRGVELPPIHSSRGIPQFFPDNLTAYLSDGEIYVVPGLPSRAIAKTISTMAQRFEAGLGHQIVDFREILRVLRALASLSDEEWMALAIARLAGSMREPDPRYQQLLSLRGFRFWGGYKLYHQCIGEDYRLACEVVPQIPNLVTCEWDLCFPAIARMSQSLVLNDNDEQQ